MDLMTYILAQKGGGGSGGSDLPVVTPADNGKILGVVSGAWSPANPDTVIDLPMTLRVGTQESPVYLAELDEGLYAINGKYYVLRNSEPLETDYNIIALVSKEEGLDKTKVKVITADDVTDYDIKVNGSSIAVYANKIVTEKYLRDNHYVVETDLAGYMPKISNPDVGRVTISNSNGNVQESDYTILDSDNRGISGVLTGYMFNDGEEPPVYPMAYWDSVNCTVHTTEFDKDHVVTGYSESWSDGPGHLVMTGEENLDLVSTGINIDDVANGLLPTVTSSDNGKILSVVNGAWDKTVSDKDVYIFTGQMLSGSNGGFLLDNNVTQRQIYNLIQEGKVVILMHKKSSDIYFINHYADPDGAIKFTYMDVRREGVYFIEYILNGKSDTSILNRDTNYIGSVVFARVPKPSSQSGYPDNGKILKVSGNEWTITTPPIELPSVTSSDNGKLLGVVNGDWDLVNGGAGGGMPLIQDPVGGMITESTSEGAVIETGYSIDELKSQIQTAYETGYSKLDPVSDAEGGRLVATTESGNIEETGLTEYQIMRRISRVTGGKIVQSVMDGEVIETNLAINDLATKSFVGSIPQGSSATTIVDYIDEVGSGLIPKMQNAEGDKVITSNSDGSISESNYTIGAVFDDYTSPNGKGVVTGHLSSGRTGYLVTTADNSGYNVTTYTEHSLSDILGEIDSAYETGYSAASAVGDKMNKFSSTPAGTGYIVITDENSSQDSLGVANIKAESVLTGYSNHDGFIAVWDKEHGNYITDAGIAASNVATKTFTGSIPQGSSATTIIDYIDEVGGSVLPSVTSSDNGKVLKVVSGEWAAATATNESNVAIFSATGGLDNNNTITLDNNVKFSAVNTALQDGKIVKIKVVYNSHPYYFDVNQVNKLTSFSPYNATTMIFRYATFEPSTNSTTLIVKRVTLSD